MSRFSRAGATLALGAAVVACSRGAPSSSSEPSPARGATASPRTTASGASAPLPALDPLARGEDCVFGHRGVLVDLGDTGGRPRLVAAERGGRIDAVERDGSTWARVFARLASLPFVATADDLASTTADGATPVLEARVRGGSARSIAVYLNGKEVGIWPLEKGEAKVVTLKLPPITPTGPQLVTGTNELFLRFRGAARAGASAPDEEAEIDWIHVGGAREDETYAAPTRTDAVTSATLGGVPMRSVSLRAPGYVRCTGWLPAAGHLMAAVGVVGAGEADLELRAVRDRAPPVVLSAIHVAGDAPWKAVDLPLTAAGHGAQPQRGGTLGAIELVAVRSTRGARVVFGEPRVVSLAAPPPADPPPPQPPVRGAVVIVLGSAAGRLIDPLTPGGTPMPELATLVKSGVVFDGNRASSGAASGALASILTGLPPRAHGVTDDEAGLAPDVTTLADVARQAGIRAAMFTANPSTGAAFGFSRGWDTYLEHPPDLADPPGAAVAPFDDAVRWIGERVTAEARFLLVIHARGAHPPWDTTPEDLRTLPPPDYSGAIDPRRAAELLSRARPIAGGPPRSASLRLNDADRTRAWALYALALKQHDAALGRLLAALKAAGREADTLLVVTGDVGLGEARAPLEDPDALSEPALASPLVVRFVGTGGGGAAAGRRVAATTSSVDVARTVVDAFGLAAPKAFEGEDLARVAIAGEASDARGRPLLAISGPRFSLRWGTFVVKGSQAPGGDEDAPFEITQLCDLSLEPDCTSDVRGAFPLALSALRRELGNQVRARHATVPVVETAAVRASLKLWGL